MAGPRAAEGGLGAHGALALRLLGTALVAAAACHVAVVDRVVRALG